MFRLIAALAATAALAGCATMTQEECAAADWRQIGYEDAVQGYPATDRLAAHTEACAEHGFSSDPAAYRIGHDEGARAYCQASNGFSVGARGGSYQGICPPDLAAAFEDAYSLGHGLHVREMEVSNTEATIRRHERRLYDIDERMSWLASVLASGSASRSDSQSIGYELQDLREEKDHLRYELDRERRNLRRAEYDLSDYHKLLASEGY